MIKRLSATVLWLFALAWAGNYVSLVTGLSPIIGGALAIAIACFVGMDPLHRFWPVAAGRGVAIHIDGTPAVARQF